MMWFFAVRIALSARFARFASVEMNSMVISSSFGRRVSQVVTPLVIHAQSGETDAELFEDVNSVSECLSRLSCSHACERLKIDVMVPTRNLKVLGS